MYSDMSCEPAPQKVALSGELEEEEEEEEDREIEKEQHRPR